MPGALLAARLVLAGVLLTAGAAKLRDVEGSRRAVRDFGAPAAWAPALGLLVPIAELAAGIALIPSGSAWWGALVALALLALFTIAIAVKVAQGREVDCHCFGQLHSSRAGPATLARNVALGAAAGFVVIAGRSDAGTGPLEALGSLSGTGTVLLLAALVLGLGIAGGAWFAIQLLRQHGRLLRRVDALEQTLERHGIFVPQLDAPSAAPYAGGLPTGAPAPEFDLRDAAGSSVSLADLLSPGVPLLLLFTHAECGPCRALTPEVAAWQAERDDLTVALVAQGSDITNRADAEEHALANVLLDPDGLVTGDYGVTGTPSAVLVDPDGRVAAETAAGADPIRALAGRPALRVVQMPHRSGTRLGESAPAIRLPDLEGNEVDLSSLDGRETLLLFWNPGCGHCQAMLEELRDFEDRAAGDAPQIVLVSSGSTEANRAMGLKSPVLLDQHFEAGSGLGARGTPTAVLLDASGRVASEPAAGADSIRALLTATKSDVA